VGRGVFLKKYEFVGPHVLQTLMKPESLLSRKLESGEAAPAFMLSLIWMEKKKLYLRLTLISLPDCLIGRIQPCYQILLHQFKGSKEILLNIRIDALNMLLPRKGAIYLKRKRFQKRFKKIEKVWL
jgi:hypothetical protein